MIAGLVLATLGAPVLNQGIVFIGGGNMAASMIGGLLQQGHPRERITVVEPDAARARALQARFDIAVIAPGADLPHHCDSFVLAVKPQQIGTVLSQLSPAPGSTIVSIAAGVRLQTLKNSLGENLHYVRCMPNTPALYGAGISGLYASSDTPPSARQAAENILSACGAVCWLEREQDLDAVTAVSGSGPAYFFLLVEAMRDAGVALGLSAETAMTLASQTCVGAARMLEQDAEDAAALRARVTSKRGTTEAALNHLENAGLRRTVEQALRAAHDRSQQLGDEIAAANQ